MGLWLTAHPFGRGLWELLLTLVRLSSIRMRGQARGACTASSTSARVAVVLEAVLGHFYVAALVTRLVGLHIVSARDQPKR